MYFSSVTFGSPVWRGSCEEGELWPPDRGDPPQQVLDCWQEACFYWKRQHGLESSYGGLLLICGNTQVLLTHAGLFQETRLSFRWRSSGWWSTTVPAWQRTCTRSSSPTGWWDRPTARCHSAGPPSMTLPSTKTAPCWWKRGMSPVGFTLQWVSLVLLAIIFLLSLAWRMSSALWAI